MHRVHRKMFQLRKVKIICKTAMVACGISDTACTIVERFERPWQTLKGISIKKIYVPELSYPTTKKIYNFKGATQQKIFMHAVSMTLHAHMSMIPHALCMRYQ
jgi:hypothetical protein